MGAATEAVVLVVVVFVVDLVGVDAVPGGVQVDVATAYVRVVVPATWTGLARLSAEWSMTIK